MRNNKPVLSSVSEIQNLSFENFEEWELNKDYRDTLFFSFIVGVVAKWYHNKKTSRTIHPYYTKTDTEWIIPGQKAGVKITSGMVHCIEDFYTRKLALISKKEETMLSTLQEEIENIEDESRKKEIQLSIDNLIKTIGGKRKELPGIKAMLIKSNRNISNLNGLLYNSLSQFFDELPGQNIVADREYKRIRRWVKGGVPDPNTADAYHAALERLKLDFKWNQEISCFELIIDGIKIDNPERYENLNDAISEGDKVPKRYFKEEFQNNPAEWRPYRTEQSLELIKVIGIALGGVVSLYDLKLVLEGILIDANLGYPGSGYNLGGKRNEYSISGYGKEESGLTGSDVIDFANYERKDINPQVENPQEKYEIQEEYYLMNKPYADYAMKTLDKYQLDENIDLREFGLFLTKIQKKLMVLIENNEDIEKVDVLDINMYTKAEINNKPSYKTFLSDIATFQAEIEDFNFSQMWFALNTEYKEVRDNLGTDND